MPEPVYSINGVSLGMSRAEVEAILGPADWQDLDDHSLAGWPDRSVFVGVSGDRVIRVVGLNLSCDRRQVASLPCGLGILESAGFGLPDCGEYLRSDVEDVMLATWLTPQSLLVVVTARVVAITSDDVHAELSPHAIALEDWAAFEHTAVRLGWTMPSSNRKRFCVVAPSLKRRVSVTKRAHSLAWPWMWLILSVVQFWGAVVAEPLILVVAFFYGAILSMFGLLVDREGLKGHWVGSVLGFAVGVTCTLGTFQRDNWFFWPTMATVGAFCGGLLELVGRRLLKG
ncbi:hypothetical protein DYH09_23065 [bacterium CPR1]|nr:hypothetical protein [bacterium CPR1]